ncbi:PAS domain S-box protein [Kamptonema cortianum]|nr:PAS domain S-box protein [Geitlerinema splendidum]MDK3158724.1 PAS domain S-box protein [Kamptonema cortianum]
MEAGGRSGELAHAIANIASARRVFYAAVAFMAIMVVGTAILHINSARAAQTESEILHQASLIAHKNSALSGEILQIAAALEDRNPQFPAELATEIKDSIVELRHQTNRLSVQAKGLSNDWSTHLLTVDSAISSLESLISNIADPDVPITGSESRTLSILVEGANTSITDLRTALNTAITNQRAYRTNIVSLIQILSGLCCLFLLISRGHLSFTMAQTSLLQSSEAFAKLELSHKESNELREMLEARHGLLQEQQIQLEETNKDISQALEHAEIQTAMHEHASRRFQSLFDGLPVGCVTFDLEGTIFEWNTMMSTIFDKPAHIALLNPLESVLMGESPDERLRNVPAQIQESAAQVSFELEMRTEAAVKVISLVFFPLHDGDGTVIGGIGCALDRTNEAEAERRIMDMAKFQGAILESTDYAIIATDTTGQVTVFNQAAEEMLGYSSLEIERGISISEFHDQNELAYRFAEFFSDSIEDRPDAIPTLLCYTANNDSVDEEWTYVRKDGRAFPIRLAISELRTESDELKGYLAVGKDITHEKRVANRLKALSLVAEKTSNAVILMDSSGHIQFVNQAFEAMCGYTLEEVSGLTAFEFRSGVFTDKIALQQVLASMSAAKTMRAEIQLCRKDGSDYWARITLSPITDQSDRCTHLILIEDDITEQKEIELKVLANEARFRDIVDASGEYIWETDPTLRLTYVSDRIEETLGYKPEDLLGRGPFDIADESEHEALAESLSEAMALHLPSRRLVVSARTKNGDRRWIKITAIPFYDADGSLVGIRGTGLDITHIKEAQDALAVEQERVRSILASIQDSFYSLDKDFNFTYVNESAADGFTNGKRSLIGRHIWDVHKEEMWEPIRKLYVRVAESGEQETMLFRHTLAGKDLEFRVYPNSEGGVSVFYQDVTARESANRQLEEQLLQINEANVQLEIQQALLEEANERLHNLAAIDGLTGLKNHRTFQSFLAEQYDRITTNKESGGKIGVILMDVDHFKQFNDSFGHPAGDEVLKKVAETLKSVAGIHMAARYGGEEFVVVTTHADEEEVVAIAEEIREAIEGENWRFRKITVSLGVAMWPNESHVHDVVDRADKALYESKRAGRNRVSVDRTGYQAAS